MFVVTSVAFLGFALVAIAFGNGLLKFGPTLSAHEAIALVVVVGALVGMVPASIGAIIVMKRDGISIRSMGNRDPRITASTRCKE
jgi:hypothetical protein